MELKELLKQPRGDAYNFELAPAIAEAYTELSIEAELKFWEELRTSLVRRHESGVLLEYHGVRDSVRGQGPQVSPETIRKSYIARRNRQGYGWTFRIFPELHQATSGTQETRLTVMCDGGGSVFFGLIGVERTEDGWKWISRSKARELLDWWSPRLKVLGVMSRTDDDWWLGWCYSRHDIKFPKTNALDPGVIQTLLHGDAITPLVDEIREAINGLVGIGASGQGSSPR